MVKKTASNSNQPGMGGMNGGGGGVGGGGYNSQLPTSAQSLAALRELYGSIECPIDITGFLPNPYDCSAYHFCNAGKDQVILCEPGLVYRQEKQVCDWPVNSQCQNKCPASSTSPASPSSKDNIKYVCLFLTIFFVYFISFLLHFITHSFKQDYLPIYVFYSKKVRVAQFFD